MRTDKVRQMESESGGRSLMTGPLLDNCATVPIVTVQAAQQCENKRDLQTPVCIEMAEGSTESHQMVDVPGAFPIKNAYVLKRATESCVPVHKVCKDHKLTFVQHAHGAALVDVQKERCYECQPDATGVQYRLPQTKEPVKAAAAMTLAVMLAAKAKQEREKAEELERAFQMHKPKCPVSELSLIHI